MADPSIRRSLDAEVQASPQKKALEEALAEADRIRGWSPGNSESRLKALMQDRNNIENSKVAEYISEKVGMNLPEKLKQMQVRDGFNKADTNGSRKTLLGAVVGNT